MKVVWLPQTNTALDEDKAAAMMKLVDILEDDDDVQDVYSNFEVSDEVMAQADCGLAVIGAVPGRPPRSPFPHR